MKFLKIVSDFLFDPFFSDLYEAEKSPDSNAMTALFEKYGER